VSAAFTRLPSNIQRLVTNTNNLSNANNTASKSYINLYAKLRMAITAVKSAARVIASWITQSNKYVEDLNLFTVALGDGAEQAKEFAETVSELMGIDPADWLRNQGLFNTLIKGFGVANEKALIMSKNLTQLGYDISSFYNISVEDAFTKLQSGIAGELEPLRRLGYDLSVARLQQEAYNLGIERSVNDMTQAEKSQLRYYAIMTQVTDAQGDMARTLNAPANQLRILQAQVTQAARALGNIFIPALNAVLPYAIALAKAIRLVANAIASLFGFSLPEIDYSGLSAGAGAVAEAAESAEDGYGGAAKAAKKLKDNLLGIDELNIIRPDDDSSGGVGGGGGGGFDIELPEYDFLGDLVSSKVDGIIEKMKEWLGLTDEINSWSDFFHTRLGHILTTVGAIGLGLAAWKVAKGVIDALRWVNMLKGYGLTNPLTIAVGISLLITGVALETAGIIDAIKNALDGENFAQIVSGGILSVGGGAFLGKGIAGWITTAFADSAVAGALETAAANLGLGSAGAAGAALGAGVMGIIAGLPMYFTGIWDAIHEGLNWLNGILIPTGSTLAGAGIGAIIGACGGPIGAGIGALIGLAVGLVTDGVIAITEHWEEIKTFFHNFFTVTIPGIWNDFVAWLKGLPETIREWWTNLLQPIKDFDWKAFGYECGQKVGGAVKAIGEAFKKFFTETLPEVWETVKTAFKTFFTETLPKFFTETIPELWETIKTAFVTFFTETLPEALSNIGEWFLDVGQAIWDGIVEGWNTAIKAIKDFIDGFVQGFKDALGINSPSTVFRDEVGVFMGEGLLEGLAKPFKAIGKWVKKNIIDPISNFIKNNPIADLVVNIKNTASEWWNKAKTWWNENAGEGISIEAFVSLAKKGWTTVKGWIGNIPTLDQAIQLIKSGWTTVKNWVGNIPILNQAISLIKDGWTTVKGWIGNIPTLSQAINLIKDGWSTVKNWIGSIPVISQAISLAKSGWTTVKGWIGNIPTLSQAISLAKSGWTTISNFVGTSVSVAISLFKSGWSSISSFVGNTVSVGVSLFKSGWSSIKSFFGLSSGGYNTGHGFQLFANGGYMNANGSYGWGIPMYANGTNNAGIHGSLFVAGENGAEMVGHIKGQTEVLNQSQIKLAMQSAITSGMALYLPVWRALNSTLVQSANAIIRSVLVSADAIDMRLANQVTYDPKNILSQSVYEESSNIYGKSRDESSMAATMRDFYREYVEPTLAEIAADAKRQADKEEQTIVQIGNRTINDAVISQQKANGYVFAK
jgi:phage-related protein